MIATVFNSVRVFESLIKNPCDIALKAEEIKKRAKTDLRFLDLEEPHYKDSYREIIKVALADTEWLNPFMQNILDTLTTDYYSIHDSIVLLNVVKNSTPHLLPKLRSYLLSSAIVRGQFIDWRLRHWSSPLPKNSFVPREHKRGDYSHVYTYASTENYTSKHVLRDLKVLK